MLGTRPRAPLYMAHKKSPRPKVSHCIILALYIVLPVFYKLWQLANLLHVDCTPLLSSSRTFLRYVSLCCVPLSELYIPTGQIKRLSYEYRYHIITYHTNLHVCHMRPRMAFHFLVSFSIAIISGLNNMTNV